MHQQTAHQKFSWTDNLFYPYRGRSLRLKIRVSLGVADPPQITSFPRYEQRIYLYFSDLVVLLRVDWRETLPDAAIA